MTDYYIPTNTDVGCGRGRHLHTNRDCGRLSGALNVRQATENEVGEYDVCKVCTGDIDRSPCSRDHLNALKEAAKD